MARLEPLTSLVEPNVQAKEETDALATRLELRIDQLQRDVMHMKLVPMERWANLYPTLTLLLLWLINRN